MNVLWPYSTQLGVSEVLQSPMCVQAMVFHPLLVSRTIEGKPISIKQSSHVRGYFREFNDQDKTHGKRVLLEKFLKFYFGLNYLTMTTLEVGEGKVARALVLKSKCPFNPKNQKYPFYSQNCFFIWKCPIVFQKCLLFIYYAYLFPWTLFFSWLYLLLILLRAAQRWYLPCFCFISSWNCLLINLWCLLDNL